MLIGSINYALSLGFVLTFLLAGMGDRVDPAHLSQPRAARGGAGPRRRRLSPAARPCSASISATRRGTRAGACTRERGEADTRSATCPRGDTPTLALQVPAARRGWLPLGRVTLETRYPLGLLRAWSYVQPDVKALVYPRPDDAPLPPLDARSPMRARPINAGAGADDFAGLRAHTPSDSPRHIAWKSVARGSTLLTKTFHGRAALELWLDYDAMPAALDVEKRLSRLTRWVLDAEAAGVVYGLRLDGATLGPGARRRASRRVPQGARALRAARMKPAPLPLPALLALFAGIALAAGPHLPRLPVWIAGTATMLLAWRAWAAWQRLALPNKWLLYILAIGGVASVWMINRTLFGRDAGVTLLVLLVSLKLMEMRSLRDVVVVTFLCYFLALTNFFYSQSMPTGGADLRHGAGAHRRARDGARAGAAAARFRPAPPAMLMLQGAPVMLVLFFLFPRVQGPLWGMPTDAYGGMTGLSDSMTPGNISSLIQSDAIAFRAKFDGRPPDRRLLYWRGPVFWDFDGRTWTAGRRAPLRRGRARAARRAAPLRGHGRAAQPPVAVRARPAGRALRRAPT